MVNAGAKQCRAAKHETGYSTIVRMSTRTSEQSRPPGSSPRLSCPANEGVWPVRNRIPVELRHTPAKIKLSLTNPDLSGPCVNPSSFVSLLENGTYRVNTEGSQYRQRPTNTVNPRSELGWSTPQIAKDNKVPPSSC